MIISASRRTDIPAFYSSWFMQRIREGYCTVFNPFNRKQVTNVSLLPSDVEVIVFWTKNPKPLFPYLKELEERGFRSYFQYTLNAYPPEFEPKVPDLNDRIETFIQLSELIGPKKVIWRYDPIILSNITGYDYHKDMFVKIAQALKGNTQRVVISFVDSYRKAISQFKLLAKQGIFIDEELNLEVLEDLVRTLVSISKENGLEVQSCAEKLDISPWGVLPGKCIDPQYIKRVFGIDVNQTKDKNQRPECGCVQSKDIGVYETCLHGCRYCYAGTIQAGLRNHKSHHVDSPSLISQLFS